MKNKNLLDPTPAQIKNRNRLWAEALLKNKRKARGEMYGDKGGRCCLAVAQDVAISCGVEVDGDYDSLPDYQVVMFFGWDSNNPSLTAVVNGETERNVASALNDGLQYIGSAPIKDKKIVEKGLRHKQIAELVMNTFVHPSKIKQSFEIR
jgi:hypothetical protein